MNVYNVETGQEVALRSILQLKVEDDATKVLTDLIVLLAESRKLSKDAIETLIPGFEIRRVDDREERQLRPLSAEVFMSNLNVLRAECLLYPELLKTKLQHFGLVDIDGRFKD